MLRWALILVSGAVLAVVAALLLSGAAEPGVAVGGVWALVLLAGLVFERRRYKRVLDRAPGEGWTATDERFIDPLSGAETHVYFNARTGARAYVRATNPTPDRSPQP